MMISTLLVCLIAVPALAFAIGYDRGRRAAELEARRASAPPSKEKQPTYREPAANGKARIVETGTPPLGGGAFVITSGPELFKDTCSRCGTRFAYRLEDTYELTAGLPRVKCPKCEHSELHSA